LHRLRQQFGDLPRRPQAANRVRATADEGSERHAAAQYRFGQSQSALDMHVLHRADLPPLRNEDVDLGTHHLGDRTASRPAPKPVPSACLDPGHIGTRTSQQKGGVDELVDGRLAGEQQDDAGEYPLPGTTFETASVHGGFRVPCSDELANRRDPERELRAEASASLQSGVIHPAIVRSPAMWRMRFGNSFADVNAGECSRGRKATFMPS
jgi:hypothetical protein